MKAVIAGVYARLLDLCGLAAGFTIAAMALAITVDVLLRNLGIANLPWLLEVSEYALYLTTFLAAPWVLRLGAHVRVDLVLNVVPAPVGKGLEILADILGAAVSLVLFWYGLLAALDSYAVNARFDKELVVSEWWLLMAIPFCSALLAVEFALRLRRAVAGDPTQATAGVSDGF